MAPAFCGNDFAEVAQAFGAENPEHALERGLVALARRGIRRVGPAETAEWIVSLGSNTLAVQFDDDLDDDTRRFAREMIRAALVRVDAEERHQRTRERAEMLSWASFEGIMVHVDGHVIDANLRVAEILRCDPAETLGDWPLRHCVAPEDLPTVTKHMAEGYEGAYVITGIRKDGERFRAEIQSKQGRIGDRPIRVAAVRDVSERERTLSLLRESEARLRELASVAFDLTFVSREGIIEDVQGPVHEILGYFPADMIGRPILEFTAPTAVPVVSERLEGARSGVYRSTAVHRSGELVPVEIFAVRSTVEGIPVRVAAVRDLRAAQRLEDERKKLAQQVERAQRLDSLGVLAGGIAHDFNNLLVGMLGNADLLLEEAQEPRIREALQAIVDAGSKAASLTGQMLAYAGRGDLSEPESIELTTFVDQLRVLLSSRLSKRARLVVDIQPGSLVRAVPATLSQVLMNLITNASDALEGNGGRIEVRGRRIRRPDARWDDAVGATVGPGSWVLIEVSDTGVGMDAQTVARAFEPFFSTKEGGHGLGLAACVGIVGALGGAVRVESEPGNGTCFSVLLPAAKEHVSRSATGAADSERDPCRVLVVDDDPVVRSQLRRSLELRGYRVCEAPDGRSGLSYLRDDGADLLLVDMTMPDLDGADIVAAVREAGSEVPIVLASGYLDAATERRLRVGSFQAFLRKPYSIRELFDAIDRARAATG